MDLEMKVPAEAHRPLSEDDLSNPIAVAAAFQMSLEIHVEAVRDSGWADGLDVKEAVLVFAG